MTCSLPISVSSVALGASYGGYMVRLFALPSLVWCCNCLSSSSFYQINWIQGQPNNPFAAMVCHDGIFDVLDAYYSTCVSFPPLGTSGLLFRLTLFASRLRSNAVRSCTLSSSLTASSCLGRTRRDTSDGTRVSSFPFPYCM
jgi:hypothetical protein